MNPRALPVEKVAATLKDVRDLTLDTSSHIRRVIFIERPLEHRLEVWLELHWWCWLALGFLHMRALHRVRQVLMRHGTARVFFDVRIY